MKAIIDNKVYDTEKAEYIRTFFRTVKVTGINLLGIKMSKDIQQECDLYKTPKENWFEHRKKMEGVWNSKEEIIPIDKETVKDIFQETGDVENYEKYFHRLEQA